MSIFLNQLLLQSSKPEKFSTCHFGDAHYADFQIIIHISLFLGSTRMLFMVRNFFYDYA